MSLFSMFMNPSVELNLTQFALILCWLLWILLYCSVNCISSYVYDSRKFILRYAPCRNEKGWSARTFLSFSFSSALPLFSSLAPAISVSSHWWRLHLHIDVIFGAGCISNTPMIFPITIWIIIYVVITLYMQAIIQEYANFQGII